jgi:hypothetical protein
MQGTIFTVLSEMVIEKLGMTLWDEILLEVKPSSGGSYTAGEQYPDEELISLVVCLSNKTNIPVPNLIESYGEYLFTHLYQSLPSSMQDAPSLRDFLLSVDKIIHKEVRRLHPNAYLPSFDYDENIPNTLVMFYNSKRKLCHAAVGLIRGASNQFKETVEIEHPECMHHGAERCRLEIHFPKSSS